MITLFQTYLPDIRHTAVNADMKNAIDGFQNKEDDVTITQTGEGKQQQETVAFLGSKH